MVSSGTLAESSACLRNQLRNVILGPPHRSQARLRTLQAPQPYRQSSTASQDDKEQHAVPGGTERRLFSRLVDTNGRIIGRPGRRQRILSQQLKTNSLDKPSSVIIFQDVRDQLTSVPSSRPDEVTAVESQPPQDVGTRQRPHNLMSGEEIAGYIAGQQLSPEQEEVNASIDSLRPASTVLDKSEFDKLTSTLVGGYNFRQLSRYIARSAIQEANDMPEMDQSRDTQTWKSFEWRRGRTPIEQRPSRGTRKNTAKSKAKLVDHILRAKWKVTVSSEEQQLGELEIKLLPWQSAILFDITLDGQANYRSIIRPRLLLDVSNIELYRPHSILRITARRQDAEEISRQVQMALLSICRYDLDLNLFKPFLDGHEEPLKLDGKSYAKHFQHISNLTRSAIAVESGHVLSIYSFSKSEQDAARRLILTLLKVPAYHSFHEVYYEPAKLMTGQHNVSNFSYVPVSFARSPVHSHSQEHVVRAVHPARSRDQSADLAQPKESLPQAQDLATVSSSDIDKLTAAITQQLVGVKPSLSDRAADLQAMLEWPVTLSNWGAEFCSILYSHSPHSSLPTTGRRPSTKPLIYPQALGIQSLAPYLSPDREGPAAPSELIVRMIPSPISSDSTSMLSQLPQVEARFTQSLQGDWKLSLVKAILDKQLLAVPLPSLALDVHFSRQLCLTIPHCEFSHSERLLHLQDMINREPARDNEPLTADAEILLQLPALLLGQGQAMQDKSETKGRYVEVPYLLERFEVVQARTLKIGSNDHALQHVTSAERDIVRNIPDNVRFTYTETEGGGTGASHSSLHLTMSEPLSSVECNLEPDKAVKVNVTEEQPLLSSQAHLPSAATSFIAKVASTAIQVAGVLTHGTQHLDS